MGSPTQALQLRWVLGWDKDHVLNQCLDPAIWMEIALPNQGSGLRWSHAQRVGTYVANRTLPFEDMVFDPYLTPDSQLHQRGKNHSNVQISSSSFVPVGPTVGCRFPMVGCRECGYLLQRISLLDDPLVTNRRHPSHYHHGRRQLMVPACTALAH